MLWFPSTTRLDISTDFGFKVVSGDCSSFAVPTAILRDVGGIVISQQRLYWSHAYQSFRWVRPSRFVIEMCRLNTLALSAFVTFSLRTLYRSCFYFLHLETFNLFRLFWLVCGLTLLWRILVTFICYILHLWRWITHAARDQDGDVEWLAGLSKSMHVIVGNQARLQAALKSAVESEQVGVCPSWSFFRFSFSFCYIPINSIHCTVEVK